MSLNIKDAETHKLVKELAREAGESLTTAVTTAVRERLERLRARRRRKKDALYAELIALGKRGAALAPGPHMDHAELLYDESGLPK
jgi:antitoxin VapB